MDTALRVLLPIVATALVACSKPAPEPEPIRAVRTMTIQSSSSAGSAEYAADIRARTETRLAFRVGGKLVSRPAEVGMAVKAGQVLARLDPEDLRQAETSARAALTSAEANQELVAAEYRRYKELRDQGFISSLELERRATSLKAAQSQVEQARAQLGVQRNQAGYTTLVASASGVVTAVEAEVGGVVAAGTPVVRLALDGPRDVVFSIPEQSVLALKALVGKPGALRVRPWGGSELLPATLREVAAAADPATRTFLARADLGKAALQLGQTATVVVEGPPLPGIARLPLTALTKAKDQSAVWVVDRSTMTVKLQPVAVGGADGNEVVVTQGLSPGQDVVVAGVHVLNAGQKVKFYAAPGGSAPVPAAAAKPASSGR